MRALGAALALAVMLLLGAGCRGKEQRAPREPEGVGNPRLAPWTLPVTDGPELPSNDVEAIAVDGNGGGLDWNALRWREPV